MALRLSRRKIAALAADKILAGTPQVKVLREVAAYLLATRRTREQTLLVRDIEDALASRGVTIADVTSAHSLTTAMKAEIAKLVTTKQLQVREHLDPTVLGGVRVDLPGKRFDGTVQRKLTALKARQV